MHLTPKKYYVINDLLDIPRYSCIPNPSIRIFIIPARKHILCESNCLSVLIHLYILQYQNIYQSPNVTLRSYLINFGPSRVTWSIEDCIFIASRANVAWDMCYKAAVSWRSNAKNLRNSYRKGN